MIAQIARVIAGAVQENRLTAAEKLYAHEVQAGLLDNAAVVTNPPLAVEDGYVEP